MCSLKEGYENYQCYLQDREENNRIAWVLEKPADVAGNAGRKPSKINFREILWKDVKVGDIVKVHADEQFPADMIFLGSSIEDESCCIDTANLDGETNLKVRKVPDALSDMLKKNLANKIFGYSARCEF